VKPTSQLGNTVGEQPITPQLAEILRKAGDGCGPGGLIFLSPQPQEPAFVRSPGEMCEFRMQAKTLLEELENKRPRAEGAVHGKIAQGAARLSPAPLPRNDWLQDKHINLS
jgi:hypothetical protein